MMSVRKYFFEQEFGSKDAYQIDLIPYVFFILKNELYIYISYAKGINYYFDFYD